MRIAVVYHSPTDSGFLRDLSVAVGRGIESQAYDVTLINACREPGKTLSGFGYIAFGLEAHSLFAKRVPDSFRSYLASAGVLSGKRCYAFVTRKGIRRFRFLASLMESLESEALHIKKSDILSSRVEAENVGKCLHIEKSVQFHG